MAARQNRPQRNRQPRNNRWMQNTSRSFLLEDFRENRYPNLQLNEIVSHVVEFATDHDGSKFIQRKMDDATENRKEAIFREMRPQMPILMKDTFANFVVQKFFDVGNESQKMELLKLIRDEFMVLSVHKYGCRVVQKAIEKSATIHQTYILMHPQHDYVQLARNANGNHVLQKCFRCVNMILKVKIVTTKISILIQIGLNFQWNCVRKWKHFFFYSTGSFVQRAQTSNLRFVLRFIRLPCHSVHFG